MKDDDKKSAPINAFEVSLQHQEASGFGKDEAVRTKGAVRIGGEAYEARSQMQTHGLPSLHYLL